MKSFYEAFLALLKIIVHVVQWGTFSRDFEAICSRINNDFNLASLTLSSALTQNVNYHFRLRRILTTFHILSIDA